MYRSVHVPGVVVRVMLVLVAFVDVVDVARLIAVVFVCIALVDVVVMRLRMMLVAVALVYIVDVARLIAVMFVCIALVDVVLLHYHFLRLLASRPGVSAPAPFADTCFAYHYNRFIDTTQGARVPVQGSGSADIPVCGGSHGSADIPVCGGSHRQECLCYQDALQT